MTEKIVFQELKFFIGNEVILPSVQYGFRGSCTTTALSEVTYGILHALNDSFVVVLIFFLSNKSV